MRVRRADHARQRIAAMTSAAITTGDLALRVSGVLRREYGDLRCADKRLAARIAATPRAVRNWFSGECPPNSATLLTLMAESEAMEAEIMALVRQHREARR